jgi:hypothetical protein
LLFDVNTAEKQRENHWQTAGLYFFATDLTDKTDKNKNETTDFAD